MQSCQQAPARSIALQGRVVTGGSSPGLIGRCQHEQDCPQRPVAIGRWVEISAWTENIRIFKLTPYFLFNIQTRCGPGPRRVLCLRTHAESDKSTNILPHCRTKYNSGLEIFRRPNMENWEKLKTNSNSICFLLQPSDLYFPVDGLRQSFVKNCHKIYGWADFLLCNKTWRLVAKTCNL